MCGIVGFTEFQHSFANRSEILTNMATSIARRGPDEYDYFHDAKISLAHRRLVVIDPEGGKQPMSFTYEGVTYTIVYNGQIYNAKELRDTLADVGFTFSSHSDTEVLLKAFIHYGYRVVDHLIGIFAFAIWSDKKQELFLARDHFGIKPLYYTEKDGEFIFASEVKALFHYPAIEPVINATGIGELFGVGPAHTPGISAFKDIFELKPAHFLIARVDQVYQEEYWNLESKPHPDSFEKTCETVKYLLEDSIERQLVSDMPLCTFLSGGLDSSIITLYASNYYQKHHLGILPTYSVDYVDNDKNFVKTDFQPNSDNEYIALMQEKLQTKHTRIVLDTPDLVGSLEDAMLARDFPGMADVDSSLLLFCRAVKKEMTVALTGECADEIFAGYPWFFREDALHSHTFPWSIALKERQCLLNPAIATGIHLEDYVNARYQESLAKVKMLDTDSSETAEKRNISYLTLNWFMQTLLDRSDRMAMYAGLELRVPFCDHRLVEYMWNVPWDMKAYNGREKGLLRHIMKEELPAEIVERKKSPYPKTWNPTYLAAVKKMLSETLEDSNAPIYELLNRSYIREILDTEGKAFTRPWFGQLMTGPQLMAYLCQVNMWLKTYRPKIEL